MHPNAPKKIRTLSVFGTRPEAIKMAPLILTLQEDDRFDSRICVTGQHREMLDQVLRLFDIVPDFDLQVMRDAQDLTEVATKIISGMRQVIEATRPDVILVHGDTATTLCASVASYLHKIPIAHVEAGLRTGNLYSPWPEEGNRRVCTAIANLHFAPTATAASNLKSEGIADKDVVITGNTVIDALLHVRQILDTRTEVSSAIAQRFDFLAPFASVVLITGHRRESFGGGFERICEALSNCARRFPETAFVYPVHLNPNVQEPVNRLLSQIPNIHLLEPLDYLPFVYLMNRASFILTDSGGIQEEAPALGKPVLVMRDTTERPEAVAAGTVKLVGTGVSTIAAGIADLITKPHMYQEMSRAHNPYGDGAASGRITAALAERFGKNEPR